MAKPGLTLIICTVLLTINACNNPDAGINTRIVKEELNNRKIRRISEAAIVEKSFEKGRKLLDTIRVIGEKDIQPSADTLSRLGNLQSVVENLQQENKAEIRKVLVSDLEGKSLKEQEREVFTAYRYNISQGLKVDDNVQLLERHIFYSAPIVENGELTGMWSIFFDKGELIKTIE